MRSLLALRSLLKALGYSDVPAFVFLDFSQCLLALKSISFSSFEKLPTVISFKNLFLFALTLPLLLYCEFSVLAS